MRLSVILPCYNITKYLSKCLDSIFLNDITDTEIILVNDGSTDNFADAIQAFFGVKPLSEKTCFDFKGSTVIVLQQRNSGVSAARNCGLREASGEYICFIDPDDYVAGHYFRTILDYTQSKKVDMLLCGFYRITEGKEDTKTVCTKILPKEPYSYCENAQIVKYLLPRYLGYSVADLQEYGRTGKSIFTEKEPSAVWRCVYRGEFLKENSIYFEQSIKYNEDGFFNMMCLSKAERVETIMDCFYYYRRWATGAISNRRGEALIASKIALVEGRTALVKQLKDAGYSVGLKSFVGNNILSVLEIMKSNGFNNREKVCTYINHPVVRESVKLMPYIRKLKFDLPLMLLKIRMHLLLFLCIRLAQKMGITLNV